MRNTVRLALFAIGISVCAAATQAAVILTYSGDSAEFWGFSANETTAATQWFAVPEGEVGTKFEFYLEKGATENPGYFANLAVYTPSNELIGIQSLSAADFGGSGAWVPLDNLSLSSGSYYAVLFTNNAGFLPYAHTVLFDPSNYADGYAATGFSGGTPLGPNQDFQARLTTVAVPEPATAGLLLISGMGIMMYRRFRRN